MAEQHTEMCVVEEVVKGDVAAVCHRGCSGGTTTVPSATATPQLHTTIVAAASPQPHQHHTTTRPATPGLHPSEHLPTGVREAVVEDNQEQQLGRPGRHGQAEARGGGHS